MPEQDMPNHSSARLMCPRRQPGRIPNVLTIAGTDPSGGAGISADLKTFGALKTFGLSVVTAVVAQNTQGVAAVTQLTGEQVRTQLTNLLADVRVDSLKIGMLGTAEVIGEVADVLATHPALADVPRVLDPVMVASSGDRLIDDGAVEALRSQLLPQVDLITPNLPEAAVLADLSDVPTEPTDELARTLTAGRRAVLLKGGHGSGPMSVDVFVCADGVLSRLQAPRVETRNTHGTGCTLSAAIAALLPQENSARHAVEQAKRYLTRALIDSERLSVGSGFGHGPVHHYHQWW